MKKKLNLRFFCEKLLFTRHIEYKTMKFAASNQSIMANKLPSIYLEQFLRRVKHFFCENHPPPPTHTPYRIQSDRFRCQ